MKKLSRRNLLKLCQQTPIVLGAILLSQHVKAYDFNPDGSISNFDIYQCQICQFPYHEANGIPIDGIEPGTSFVDFATVIENCTQCGASIFEYYDLVE